MMVKHQIVAFIPNEHKNELGVPSGAVVQAEFHNCLCSRSIELEAFVSNREGYHRSEQSKLRRYLPGENRTEIQSALLVPKDKKHDETARVERTLLISIRQVWLRI